MNKNKHLKTNQTACTAMCRTSKIKWRNREAIICSEEFGARIQIAGSIGNRYKHNLKITFLEGDTLQFLKGCGGNSPASN